MPKTSELSESLPVAPDALQPATPNEPPEVLFPEAKRRGRRRRLAVGIALLVVAGVGSLVGVLLSSSGAPSSPPLAISPAEASLVPAGAVVRPEAPYSLAAGPVGTVYVVDDGRNQILRMSPAGQFVVVAGTGHRGFSGDGASALDAELSLDWSAGIVVARSGAVYFSDTSNGRVREIRPDGVIITVAGGGAEQLDRAPVSASSAALGDSLSVLGLTIGPDGDLYIADSAGIYRLGDGRLFWIAGGRTVPNNWAGVYGNPAAELDFAGARSIAFDGRGDLLASGGGAYGLYEKSASGKLRFIEEFRGDGAAGALAPAPSGDVLLAAGEDGIAWWQPNGTITRVNAASLDKALGRNATDHFNIFKVGNGAAVGPGGVVYVDTDVGNTFTAVSAIVELFPNGTARTLWRS